MRRLLLALGFIAFGVAATGQAEENSVVTVGARSARVKDSVVRLVSAARGATIETYFFGSSLTPEARRKLIAKRGPSVDDFEALVGQVPLLELDFFFETGSRSCNDFSFVGYNAVFRGGQNVPFKISPDTPVTFNFTKTPKVSGETLGVRALFCALNSGSPFIFEVQGQKTAESFVAYNNAPPISFSWRVSARTSLP
jgi:hypothetical protein